MKVNVVYLEHATEDGEAVVHTEEEQIAPQHLPRNGEEIYVGGKTRTVCRVVHYSDTSIQVFAFHADDYPALCDEHKQRMKDYHADVPSDPVENMAFVAGSGGGGGEIDYSDVDSIKTDEEGNPVSVEAETLHKGGSPPEGADG